ncbi:MAG: nucleotidyltransferase [Thermodesulfobacteriota bacterium]|nr:nucleotidyltransferase [Thermodesulfobacteriota bacterium]
MFQKLLKKIARELKKASIPYMVIGGQAILLYGEPRLTRDIDITLGINVDQLDKVLAITSTLRLKVLVGNEQEFVQRTMVLPAMEEESGIRVDFIFSFSPYEKRAIERAREVRLGRTPVRFGSLEDVVIHKVIAGRPRDIEDIRSILLKNTNYDSGYIEKWLKEFDASLGENFLALFRNILKEI